MKELIQGLGAAIVGTGFMGSTHAEALRRLGVPIVGVLGSTPEKSSAAAVHYGAARGYVRFEEVLHDDDVKVVHVVTPNRLHFDMASRALRAGKHVMCEKPLAMTSQESFELVRMASAHPDQAAGVTYNVRFYPLCHEARAKVADGQLGRVFHVQGSYVQDWLSRATDYNWRVLAEEGGRLRAAADVGTHWLDLVQFITGRLVVSVCADLATIHPLRQRPTGEVQTFSNDAADEANLQSVEVVTDDASAVMLRFDDGTRGVMWVSQTTPGRKNCIRFEIAGQDGTLAWNSESPNEMWIGRRGAANELLLRDPGMLVPSAARLADYPAGHNEGYADTFKMCFRAFYSDIASGAFRQAPTYPTFAEGHHEMLLCDAMWRSARVGGWVNIEGVDA